MDKAELETLLEPYLVGEQPGHANLTGKRVKRLPELSSRLASVECSTINLALGRLRKRLARQGPLTVPPTANFPAPSLLTPATNLPRTPVYTPRAQTENPFNGQGHKSAAKSIALAPRVEHSVGNVFFEVVAYNEGGRGKVLILFPKLATYSVTTRLGEGNTSIIVAFRYEARKVNWNTCEPPPSSMEMDAINNHFRTGLVKEIEIQLFYS
jgi:hypothetical protein